MHAREIVESVLRDCGAGVPVARIARERGLPRSTVRDWCAGRVPQTEFLPEVDPWLDRSFPVQAYARLLGTYLGDGCISEEARTLVLRVFFDARYPGLIADTVNDLRAIRPDKPVHVNRRASTNCVVAAARWRHWDVVFPQHGPGPKHTRTIELAAWQRDITVKFPEAFVRGLLNSDGCRYINRVTTRGREYAYPSYEFKNASQDIHALLREHLDLLGVAWRRAGERATAITTRAGVARLDEFVGEKR